MNKKLLLVLILVAVIVTGTAFAQTGIGVQGGGSFGSGSLGGAALTLKLSGSPIYWAFNFSAGSGYSWMGLSGDVNLLTNSIISGLDWYVRVGGLANVAFFRDNFYLNVGVQLPVGIAWRPLPPLELYLQVGPRLGINILQDFGFGIYGFGNIGIRYWF